MKAKLIVGSVLVAALATPVFAAEEYWIVQDTTSKKCSIVDKKPTAATTVVVGDAKAFKTKAEAEAGMKTTKVCVSM